MKTKLEIVSSINRKITITIPADKINGGVDKKINSVKGSVTIDGFRKGKVPLSVIRKRYEAPMRAEVINEMIQSTYSEALQTENIMPASQPEINAEKEAFLSGDFTYTALFEVYPDIKLSDLSKVKIDIPKSKITKVDIDKTIKNLQEKNRIFDDSKVAAKQDSKVTINFVGTIDGKEFDGGKADNVPIVIGSGNMIKGFEDGLVGLKIGDDTILNLSFPKDYQTTHLAGKNAEFAVTVIKVENPKLPKLDEEFFKKFNVKDEQGFRTQIEKNLNLESKRAKNRFIKSQVMDILVNKHDKIELPKAVVEQETNKMIKTLKNQMQTGGQSMDALFKDTSAMQPEAQRRVRLGLVISEIIDVNKITVNKDKLDAFIAEEASAYDDPQQFIDHYKNEKNRTSIEPVVLESQVVDHIVANGISNEVTLNFDDLMKKTGSVQS